MARALQQLRCRLEDDSSPLLQLAHVVGLLKKQSTQNTQFARVLFLFLLPDALAAFCFCFDAALSLLFLLLCA